MTPEQVRIVVRTGLLAHRRARRQDGQLVRCVCGWAGPGPALPGHIADAIAQLVVAALWAGDQVEQESTS